VNLEAGTEALRGQLVPAGADLRGADLRGADLQGANLQEAQLQGANLQETFLWQANLQGAQFQGVDLTGAIGLTLQQIGMAVTDERTRLPEYLRLPVQERPKPH
jgi:uncharacterized protein YjbI with pentapeptide repeats